MPRIPEAKLAHINPVLRRFAVPLASLHPDPENARQHPQRNIDAILAAFKRFGQRTPFVVNDLQERRVLKGNGGLTAARLMGWQYVAVIPVGIADPTMQSAYAIADNRTGELAAWDVPRLDESLTRLADAGWDLDADLAFSEDELADLRALAPEDDPPLREDDVPPAPTTPTTQPGDVWTFPTGHRLVCGDSMDDATVRLALAGRRARMSFTDPPYNVSMGSIKHPKFRQRAIANDDLTPEDWRAFCHTTAALLTAHVEGCIYVCHAPGPDGRIMAQTLDDAAHWSATITWVKDAFTLGRANYQRQYEPIWYGWPKGKTSTYNGDRTESDVWTHDRPKKSEEHPTMKPVALVAQALQNSSQKGDVVLDPFLGSGTTLIACEQTGRICAGIELSPTYCDVILERYYNLTGKSPTRESDGLKWTDAKTPREAPTP